MACHGKVRCCCTSTWATTHDDDIIVTFRGGNWPRINGLVPFHHLPPDTWSRIRPSSVGATPFKEKTHLRCVMGQTIHVVQTTLPGSWNDAQIGQYAQSLLDHGAACVQIQNIRSVYRWDHQTQSENEWRIQLKTSQSNLDNLLLTIEQTHPYDSPQIISWPASTTDEYGKWVSST